MNREFKFELIDWLSALAGVAFVAVRAVDMSPLLFVAGSFFCILEGVIDIFLYFKKEKESRKTVRLLYSAFLVLASLQGVYLLYVKTV